MVKHNSYPNHISNDELMAIFESIKLPGVDVNLNAIDYEEMFNTLNFHIFMEIESKQITLKYWTRDLSYKDLKNSDSVTAIIELAVFSNVDKIEQLLS